LTCSSSGEIQLVKGKSKTGLSPKELKIVSLFFTTGAMASNAKVNPPDEEHVNWYTVGDPTEGALITLAQKAGVPTTELDGTYPELREFAFDSVRKRMSSIRWWQAPNDDKPRLYLFAKGAPESILEQCESSWDHGLVRKFTRTKSSEVLARNEQLAKRAMRNLAFAYKVLPDKTNLDKLSMDEAESGMTYLGMVSMIDPLRDDVKVAMDDARKAHIKVSIVTGDYALTARAIALQAGLGGEKGDITIVTGQEIRSMDDAYIIRLVKAGDVIFSRVSPEDKLRIVGLVKDSGEVVAVTGDGINDAPALKRADIGVAMGRTGTDVAKQSAEIVLLDDSFHTLIGAIKQGRVVFQNIKKATLCVFTVNAAELTVNLAGLAAASIAHIPLAMTVMELLSIDLIAELFPVAALAWDKGDGELMSETPRNPHDHILSMTTIPDLVFGGLLIGLMAYANYLLFFSRAHIDPRGLSTVSLVHMKATTLTYLTIVLCQLGNVFHRRSRYGLFTRYQLHNKQLWFAVGLSLFFVVNIIYNHRIAPYFGTSALSALDWFYALGATAIFLAVREFQRYTKQHSRKAVHALHPAIKARA
jgi:Ca2+-transporting ATPase